MDVQEQDQQWQGPGIRRTVPATTEMDEESQAKKDDILDSLQIITMHNFTEMKAMNNPPQLIKDVLVHVYELLFGIKADYKEARLKILCNPRVFIDKAHQIEDGLEGYHLDVLTKYKKLQVDPDEVGRKNSACYGLAKWMDSLTSFCDHMGYLDVKKRSKYGPKPN